MNPRHGTTAAVNKLAWKRAHNQVTVKTCDLCGHVYSFKSFRIYTVPTMAHYRLCSSTCAERALQGALLTIGEFRQYGEKGKK